MPQLARAVRTAPRKLLKPGAVAWTWIPYIEADGRGKSRPCVIVDVAGVKATVMPLGGQHHGVASSTGCPIDDWLAAGLSRPSGIQSKKYVVDVRKISSVLGNLTAADWQVASAWADRADRIPPVEVADAPAV